MFYCSCDRVFLVTLVSADAHRGRIIIIIIIIIIRIIKFFNVA